MIRAAIVTLSVALFALPAMANEEAEQIIAEAASQLSDPVEATGVIVSAIDVPAVARFTLGKYVHRVSDADQARFTDALDVFLKQRLEDEQDNVTGARVSVVGSTDRDADDSIVETEVARDGEEPMTVRWRVINGEQGWRIVDVEVAGLWLAIEQRAQIAAILAEPRATIDDAIAALG